MRTRRPSEICPKCKKKGFTVQAWRRKSYYANSSASWYLDDKDRKKRMVFVQKRGRKSYQRQDFDKDRKIVVGKKRYVIRMGHYDKSRPYNRRWCNLIENIHYKKIFLINGRFWVKLIRTKLPRTNSKNNASVRHKNNNTKSRSDIRLNRLIYNAKNYKDYRFIEDVIKKIK